MSPDAPSNNPVAPSAAAAFPAPAAMPRLVVIGNFDGVHLGHQQVLRHASSAAEPRGLRPTVLTFEPHPRQVLSGQVMPVLTTLQRKRRLIEELQLGVEVDALHFTKELAALSPREFAEQILAQRLQARVVRVGENFRFGRGRSGDLEQLRSLGEELGFSAEVEELHGDAVGAYSSTRVRRLLDEGEVESAAVILGRPHLMSGTVTRGDQRGRTLGFPTANLGEVAQYLPGDGVYAARVYDLDAGARFLAQGALNLGARPTVDRPRSVEVHLLDFSADLYGKQLGVELIARVRAVEKFASVEALQAQIQQDVATTRRLLSSAPEAAPRAPGF